MRVDALKALLRRLAIPVTEERIDKKRGGVWLNAQCPFAQWTHKSKTDRTPSFGAISDDKGKSSFKCYGCKQHGTVAALVRQLSAYRRQDYTDILLDAREAEKGTRHYASFDDDPFQDAEELEPLDDAMWDGLFDPVELHPVATDFLAQRGVSLATAQKLNLQYDTDQKRIIFEVRGANRELYGFTGRTVLPKERLTFTGRDGKQITMPKVRDYAGLPKLHLIMGRDRWVPGKPVLMVEGLFAFARMHEIGAEDIANIGAALGAELNEEKAAIIRDFGETCVLMFDPDEAGDAGIFGVWDEAAQRHKIEEAAIGRLFGHVPVVVPDYPEMDVPDPDYLTLDQVREMIAQPSFRPNKFQRKSLEKAGIGWTTKR